MAGNYPAGVSNADFGIEQSKLIRPPAPAPSAFDKLTRENKGEFAYSGDIGSVDIDVNLKGCTTAEQRDDAAINALRVALISAINERGRLRDSRAKSAREAAAELLSRVG
jgi:hypothetical protein